MKANYNVNDNNNKKQNKNEQSELNETYRLFLSASISCIIPVPNISTKSSTCEISVLHSPTAESFDLYLPINRTKGFNSLLFEQCIALAK